MASIRTSSKILDQLKDQVLNFLDDLLSICPNEPDLLLVRLFFENQIDIQALMKGFNEWVLPWKDSIKAHDITYFEKNDHVFGPLPPEKVAHFKVMVKDGTFDKEDMKAIWAYFEVFISLVEQYNKVK